jgi:hypothetical protein
MEYVDTLRRAAIQTAVVKETHSEISVAMTWAVNHSANQFHKYAAERSKDCSLRMQAMSKTAQWYEMERRFFFWRFLVAVCLCWKLGQENRVPSVHGFHDAVPFVRGDDFGAWLRDEGQKMIYGLGLFPAKHREPFGG